MTTVVGGDLKKIDLCEDCARNSGAIHPAGFLAADLILQEAVQIAAPGTAACPACGYTLETLQKTGRLGCGVCYENFFSALQAALVESQRDVVHRGKRPARKKATRQELEKEMQFHVERENYEEAARLRDRIRRMKSGPLPKEGMA
ncbi:MAG: excinuclease ABC subunit B [Verrucomicrobia bacterium]|nr:excinuclease ABC subunit B [Verrucomicrobiota bacterium]